MRQLRLRRRRSHGARRRRGPCSRLAASRGRRRRCRQRRARVRGRPASAGGTYAPARARCARQGSSSKCSRAVATSARSSSVGPPAVAACRDHLTETRGSAPAATIVATTGTIHTSTPSPDDGGRSDVPGNLDSISARIWSSVRPADTSVATNSRRLFDTGASDSNIDWLLHSGQRTVFSMAMIRSALVRGAPSDRVPSTSTVTRSPPSRPTAASGESGMAARRSSIRVDAVAQVGDDLIETVGRDRRGEFGADRIPRGRRCRSPAWRRRRSRHRSGRRDRARAANHRRRSTGTRSVDRAGCSTPHPPTPRRRPRRGDAD